MATVMPMRGDGELVRRYRRHVYRIGSSRRLKDIRDAVRFIDEVGIAFLWPISGVNLPSLWIAAAGDRPVPTNPNDPGHITWRWKDQMLGKGIWYYGKLVRGKSTFASLSVLPFLYCVSPRLGELGDFREAYEEGHLSWEACHIAGIILEHGPKDTLALRTMGSPSPTMKARVDRALVELQHGLWVIPVGISEVGGWKYAFVYDLLDRHFPEMATKAHSVSNREARVTIAGTYIDAVGSATVSETAKLMGWSDQQAAEAFAGLEQRGRVLRMDGNVVVTKKVYELRQ